MRLISFLSCFSSRTKPSQSPRFAHLSLFLWLNMHFYKCHFPDPLSTAFCKTQLRHTSVHTGLSSCQPRVPPTHTHHPHTLLTRGPSRSSCTLSHRHRSSWEGRCVPVCVHVNAHVDTHTHTRTHPETADTG